MTEIYQIILSKKEKSEEGLYTMSISIYLVMYRRRNSFLCKFSMVDLKTVSRLYLSYFL